MGEPKYLPETSSEAAALRDVLYRLLERHDAEPDVLAIVGSLFDTMSAKEIIDLAEDWLARGKYMEAMQ